MKRQKLMVESIRYITGVQKSIKLQGKKQEILAFKKVLNTSRSLYECLQKENPSLEKIENLVAKKRAAAAEFYKVTGQHWML